jgi:hypothetical protein
VVDDLPVDVQNRSAMDASGKGSAGPQGLRRLSALRARTPFIHAA